MNKERRGPGSAGPRVFLALALSASLRGCGSAKEPSFPRTPLSFSSPVVRENPTPNPFPLEKIATPSPLGDKDKERVLFPSPSLVPTPTETAPSWPIPTLEFTEKGIGEDELFHYVEELGLGVLIKEIRIMEPEKMIVTSAKGEKMLVWGTAFTRDNSEATIFITSGLERKATIETLNHEIGHLLDPKNNPYLKVIVGESKYNELLEKRSSLISEFFEISKSSLNIPENLVYSREDIETEIIALTFQNLLANGNYLFSGAKDQISANMEWKNFFDDVFRACGIKIQWPN